MSRRPAHDLLVEEFPSLARPTDNAIISIEVTSPTGSLGSDNGYVSLRISDAMSGTVLADLNLDPARFWRLLQGGTQTWPGFVSPHLDRVGKRMLSERVVLPASVEGDGEREQRRVVHEAVVQQLPGEWWDTWESYDTPRRNNRRTLETVVRRWVPVTTED